MGLNGVSADVCVEHMCGARSWANGLSCAYGYIFNNLNDIPWSSASVSLSLSLSLSLSDTHTHTHTLLTRRNLETGSGECLLANILVST